MTLRELQEKRARLVAAARERLDQINDNTDESRAVELESQHDAAMAELDALDAQIERAQRVADAESRQAEMDERAARARAERRPGREDRSADNGDTRPTYRDAFHAMLRAGGEVSDLSGELRSILRGEGLSDEEVRQQLTTTEGAGGYTVPVELQARIIEAMEATGPMYDGNFTTVLNTSAGSQIQIPAVDDTGDTSTGAHNEGTVPADDNSGDVAFTQRVLDAYIYKTPFVKWSLELGADSVIDIEALIARLLGRRLGKLANQKLTVGTGTNEPNGVVTAASAGNTAASQTALAFDEFIALEHSVDPAYRASASYMLHDTTVEAVRKLKDGDGNYLWTMGNVQNGVPSTINGRAYRVNQAMPTVAAGTSPVLFGDFSEYYVRRVGSPVMGVMREKFWPNLGIAGLVRFDGEIGDARAIKKLTMASA